MEPGEQKKLHDMSCADICKCDQAESIAKHRLHHCSEDRGKAELDFRHFKGV